MKVKERPLEGIDSAILERIGYEAKLKNSESSSASEGAKELDKEDPIALTLGENVTPEVMESERAVKVAALIKAVQANDYFVSSENLAKKFATDLDEYITDLSPVSGE
jgi:anti-sigma28 factor (negative regulator of flagellin synthesis)